jgi:hypothetical protein
MMTRVKKHGQAYRTAARLPLLLLIVSMLTVPIMLFSAPLAAADVVADCKNSGGTYVVNDRGVGQCLVTVEPICHKLPHMEVPDPELCLKSGGIINIPIVDGNLIASEVEDTVEGIGPIVVDGNLISEAVRDSVEGIVPIITDDNR